MVPSTLHGGSVHKTKTRQALHRPCGMYAACATVIATLLLSPGSWAQEPFNTGLSGTGFNVGNTIIAVQGGGYAVAGVTNSASFSVRGSTLIRLNENGDTLWTRIYGTNGVGYAVQELPAGGFLYAGERAATPQNFRRGVLIRTDENGDTLWSRTMDVEPFALSPLTDGSYAIGGQNSCAAVVGRVDATGAVLSWKELEILDCAVAQDIQETNGGGTILTGVGFIGGDAGLVAVRLNAAGGVQWARRYSTARNDYGYAVRQLSDGGFVFAGSSNGDIANLNAGSLFVIRTDADGDTLWTRNVTITGHTAAYSLALTTDGGMVLHGVAEDQMWMSVLVKLNADGSIAWSRALGPEGSNVGFEVLAQSDGRLVTTGSLGTQVHVTRLPSDGNACGTQPIVLNDLADAVVVDEVDVTVSDIPATLGAISFNVTRGFDTDDQCATGIAERGTTLAVACHPTPASDAVYIDMPETPGAMRLDVIDARGRTVKELKGPLTDRVIDVRDLPAGPYRLRVSSADGSRVGSAALLIAR